ncbi:branched-chain amino acid ABC transporter permease [Clostridium sp. AM58-1XD]|uniref:branched-chain amino acid ABC transporter permease n=1 Tax=Clostridium sp. AM58-1XD TaxID=2292307 RepID=UPI000E546E60|nr:branched-chain amino acid ABC transporter permease [Clostridium sp. AM58-1XD]RGY99939.1 branched-chain amino acid ABC transporter permease [Clostridium sp. AM58-1XD]
MEGSIQKRSFIEGKRFAVLGFLLLLIMPFMMGTYYQSIMILILFYAFCATAWNVVCGLVGELSLGHSLFLGLGAYISTILLRDLSLTPWIGMLIGAAVTCAVGVLIGYPCFRLSGPYFALTTIALTNLVKIWVENNEYFFGIDVKGSMGLLLEQTGNQPIAFEFGSKLTYYYIMFVFLVIALFIMHKVKSSKMGYYLTAIKTSPEAAEAMGIPIRRYKLMAMAVSCALMAVGGTFYAQYYRYVGPTRIFGEDLAIQIAMIALVGGSGKTFGPLIGAVILVPVTELLSKQFGGVLPGLHLFVYGIVMIFVVFFMPKGIYDIVTGFFKRLESRIFHPSVKGAGGDS